MKKKRLDLNISQSKVASVINVQADTITNWELNRNQPKSRYISRIISFLGYTPNLNENKIKKYRIEKGMSQKELAKALSIDPTTLSRVERGIGSVSEKVLIKLELLCENMFSE